MMFSCMLFLTAIEGITFQIWPRRFLKNTIGMIMNLKSLWKNIPQMTNLIFPKR